MTNWRRHAIGLAIATLMHGLLLDYVARNGVVAVLFAPSTNSSPLALLLALAFLTLRLSVLLFGPLWLTWILFSWWRELQCKPSTLREEEAAHSSGRRRPE